MELYDGPQDTCDEPKSAIEDQATVDRQDPVSSQMQSTAPEPGGDRAQRLRELEVQRRRHLERLGDFAASAAEEVMPLDAAMQLSLSDLLQIEETIAHALKRHQLEHGSSLSEIKEMLPALEAYTKLAREKEKLAKFNTRHECKVPPFWTEANE